jgi:hypothetical protein
MELVLSIWIGAVTLFGCIETYHPKMRGKGVLRWWLLALWCIAYFSSVIELLITRA